MEKNVSQTQLEMSTSRLNIFHPKKSPHESHGSQYIR